MKCYVVDIDRDLSLKIATYSRLPITRTSRQLEAKLICPEFPVQICLSFAPRSIYFLLPLEWIVAEPHTSSKWNLSMPENLVMTSAYGPILKRLQERSTGKVSDLTHLLWGAVWWAWVIITDSFCHVWVLLYSQAQLFHIQERKGDSFLIFVSLTQL